MPVGSLVTRTPEEIEVIEIQPHVVPAGVAGVIIDDAVRRCEFVRRMGKAGNHHHRDTAPPCEPAQSARQTDEEVRILDQIDPFLKRLVSGFVLGSPRDMIPDQTRPVP